MEFVTRKKYLYLILSVVSLIALMGMTTLLWWFIAPRLEDIHEILRPISLTFLRIFFSVLLIGTTMVILTSLTEVNFLIAKFAVKLYNRVMYPVTILLGKLIGLKKEQVRESYVHVNNSFIKAMNLKFDPDDILILLPHCLQDSECKIRISNNIENCVQCGRCNIGDLLTVAKKFKVPIAIANGGTLARRIVYKYKPKFIIAVACDRDLVSGIQDVYPIPVFGIFNLRPNGPCFNTKVDAVQVENALRKLLNEET